MDYTPIRISTILPNKPLSFQLFINYKDHFLKYIEIGKAVNDTLLAKLKHQQIARFYIRDQDENNYQTFLDEILETSMKDPTVSVDEKVNFAEGTTSTAIEEMQKHPESKEGIKMTNRAAKTLRQIISADASCIKSLYQRQSTKNELMMKHCMNVSALCVNTCKEFDIAEETIQNLAVAAILHDIGVTHMGPECEELFHMDYAQMTEAQKQIYEQHPARAKELLAKNPLVPEATLELIFRHEENLSGNGYPNHLKKLVLPEEILSLCNNYDKRVTVLGQTPQEALKVIQLDQLGNYGMELINKFKKVTKIALGG